jgi:hypothetical protein
MESWVGTKKYGDLGRYEKYGQLGRDEKYG